MVNSLERFSGKVAVVTGASAGIGAAIAEELVKNGLIVAGLARRTDRVDSLAQKLAGEKGKLHAFKCDMTKETDVKTVIQEVVHALGPIHVLVNNAGLMLPTTLITGDTEKWRTTIDTNIIGLCIATREVIQQMKEHGIVGHIIHLNSVLGHKVYDIPTVNVYGATKFAVTCLAETLRMELKLENLKIKVTSISPGYVETEFKEVAGIQGELPYAALYPPDIANAVVYALSTPAHVNVEEITVQAVGN